jgi:hypothetical protein
MPIGDAAHGGDGEGEQRACVSVGKKARQHADGGRLNFTCYCDHHSRAKGGVEFPEERRHNARQNEGEGPVSAAKSLHCSTAAARWCER